MLIKNLTVCCSFRKTYFADRYRETFLRIFLFSLTKIILSSFFNFNILNSGYPSKFILANSYGLVIFKRAYRKSWTLDAWSGRLDSRRLDSGHLDSGRLEAWTLDAWALNAWTLNALRLGLWTLGLWTTGRLDSGQLNASNYRLTVPSSDYILKWLHQECFLGNFPKAFGAPKHHRL